MPRDGLPIFLIFDIFLIDFDYGISGIIALRVIINFLIIAAKAIFDSVKATFDSLPWLLK
jgi:hypothetical protein